MLLPPLWYCPVFQQLFHFCLPQHWLCFFSGWQLSAESFCCSESHTILPCKLSCLCCMPRMHVSPATENISFQSPFLPVAPLWLVSHPRTSSFGTVSFPLLFSYCVNCFSSQSEVFPCCWASFSQSLPLLSSWSPLCFDHALALPADLACLCFSYNILFCCLPNLSFVYDFPYLPLKYLVSLSQIQAILRSLQQPKVMVWSALSASPCICLLPVVGRHIIMV